MGYKRDQYGKLNSKLPPGAVEAQRFEAALVALLEKAGSPPIRLRLGGDADVTELRSIVPVIVEPASGERIDIDVVSVSWVKHVLEGNLGGDPQALPESAFCLSQGTHVIIVGEVTPASAFFGICRFLIRSQLLRREDLDCQAYDAGQH